MKRLTTRNENGTIGIGEPLRPYNYEDIKGVLERLANIEDILGDDYDLDRLRELIEACKGLYPSEIAENKLLIATRKDPEKLARMAELVEADRDGRCVVLPKAENAAYRWLMDRFEKRD